MKKVAILASDNMLPGHPEQRADFFERDEQMGKLVPAFAAQYFEGNEAAFTAEMAKVETQTQLFNDFSTLKWNANKTYLDELEREGAPVIGTITVERVSQTSVEKAFEELQTDTLVIKPQIGGGAWRQVLYKQGDPFPKKETLPPEGAMIQAFLPSVVEEGEYSFLYFGGQFSHGLIKRPKKGDYRIQSLYGGTEDTYEPSRAERAARSMLAWIYYAAKMDS